jgi:hypothetical protein
MRLFSHAEDGDRLLRIFGALTAPSAGDGLSACACPRPVPARAIVKQGKPPGPGVVRNMRFAVSDQPTHRGKAIGLARRREV